ncbi:MAG: KH domain-containing protein [Desulfobacterales bacterium]
MENLIRIIVMALVDFPDEVAVKQVGSNHISIYEIRVAGCDTGKVVGKNGRNVQALRTIVNAVSSKQHCRSLIEILE